ncbi:zinc finger protein 616 isoform X2 [Drosophila innubila]|uniref:zinc finger protein 616 isoform X2 n=1 Tax=Drosophila innubila TaxID=198719 RepID=UPI00148D1FD5|nr:zinc finger protein 616 isoform X2 [Drosophila innubila]
MSENLKTNNESEPSCLHCRVHNSKQPFQEIFDELGIEIELPELLAKYFQINIKPDPQKQQLLCEECVKTLIRFFDIDELQREQDAAAKDKSKKQIKNETTPSAAIKKGTKLIKKQTPPAIKVNNEPKKLTTSVKLPTPAAAAPAARVATAAEPVSIRITRAKAVTVTPKRNLSKPKTEGKRHSAKEAGTGEQEQISELLRDILDDEKTPPDDKCNVAVTKGAADEKQLQQVAVQEEEQEDQEEQQDKQRENAEELEFLLEPEDGSSDLDVRQFKLEKNTSVDSQSLSEDESMKVEPFNFVLIKESDGIEDLYEYLTTVVKTCFETLTFEWATVCCHCSLKCSKFESLLAHMQKCHQLPEEHYKCPIEECNAELPNRKFLAMHLVLLHAPVADIPIYGSCPECNMTFSNILQYNKHSCAHVIKKRRGARLYCEMCGLEFPSWKRFNFHNQFHLERHRPRACFVCSYADNNIDELFQHLHYSHEPEGTLFCDICDRYFRDPAVFTDHNKTHANVGGATHYCSSCSATFETRGRLSSHIRAMHGSIISCELCSREFASESNYHTHMKKHLIIEREVHVCSNCGILNESQEKMMSHVENADTVCFGVEIYVELLRDAYVCEYCSAYFKQKTDLRAHRESGIHKDGFCWCQPCGKEFHDMKIYRHHLRNLQQQLSDVEHRKLEICVHYMCDYQDCFESYINWNSLYTHKKRNHNVADTQVLAEKVNEWICQFCQKVCRSKMSLSVHVARSHNNNNVICPICKASYKDDEALKKHHAYWHEPMKCALCLKMVKNRRNYDTHMNVVHSNNKRYNCDVCDKGFYHRSEMEAHKRLHSQLYSCAQCSFSTRNKNSLSVHVLGQHYKRFAFECKTCNKNFGRRQGLTNHMQRVHGSKNMCSDYFEGGCNKTFSTISQLNVHVRKAHDNGIELADLVEDYQEDHEEQLDDEDQQDHEEQEVYEVQEQTQEQEQQQERKSKRKSSTAASTSKKRCIRIIDDTQIEFMSADEDNVSIMDAENLDKETKFKPTPVNRKKKHS